MVYCDLLDVLWTSPAGYPLSSSSHLNSSHLIFDSNTFYTVHCLISARRRSLKKSLSCDGRTLQFYIFTLIWRFLHSSDLETLILLFRNPHFTAHRSLFLDLRAKINTHVWKTAHINDLFRTKSDLNSWHVIFLFLHTGARPGSWGVMSTGTFF